ncbi:MAG TPA: carboxypeptidase-like regulatory domain-containing protein [Terracidiphilus sp.]|nr:carboxypeptidase-like regulatory domain-containing protein [Terracidiphilus sp.]
MKNRRAACLTVLVLAALSAGVVPSPTAGIAGPSAAEAQNIGERTVTGTVFDSDSKPVSGATVFLQNEKTKTIRSYISDTAGSFNFAQVDMSQDFDLWAEKGKLKSATKVVSSWDSRTKWIGDLRLK